MSPHTSTACPPTTDLQHLLEGSLSGEQQQACTQHMDSCTCCQQKLEEIATAGTNLSQVVVRLHESQPVANSAYWKVIQQLDSEGAETLVPNATPVRTRDLSLSFLQPSEDSAYLGRMAQFDVMRVIGRGGMGLVLEAFDSRLQRNVALKVLDPEFASDEVAQQRFCREARAAASITHENVVAVHQVERSATDRLPYLVMQLISGESLEQRLTREKKLPLTEIVRIGMQAAQGLAAAHAQGLIHRDIKPGNILLEAPQDRVKLTDFGLARAAEDVKLTRTGFVSGTPLYMAPEQALGEEADPRSDLFSLGAILYEMCAGQPPFTGNSALAILKQIADTKQRPIKELNPSIPDWMSETIDRLLAKKPADRIQTAAQLAELLEFEWALMRTTSEEVPTVCKIKARQQRIRNRWIALALGTTFLVLGLLGGFYLSPPSNKTLQTPVSAAEPVAVLSANSGAVWSVSFDQKSQIVAMAVEDGTVRLWDLPQKSVLASLDAHRGAVWNAQFSHTGERFVTSGDDGEIKVWQAGETKPLQTFQHPKSVRAVTFDRTDERIYAGDREGGLRIWSLKATEPLAQVQQPGSIYAIALSPDGTTLASAGSDKIVRLWNANTLSLKFPLEGHHGPVYGLCFHRDGRRLASVGWDKSIRIWDTSNGQLLHSWEGHAGDIWSAVFSPDGTRLATGGHDGIVKLWNPETGELLASYLGHQTAIHSLTFNTEGSLLASGGRDGAVRIWEMKR